MERIFITGASRGIGKALCLELAKSQNARFALIARNSDLLSQIKKELELFGSEAEIFPCDVSNYAEFMGTIKKSVDFLGGIDIAILNAGISYNKWITEDGFSKTFEEIYKTNVFSIAYALEKLYQLMKTRGGKIVIVSSLADVRGFPSSSAYCSSKAAVSKLAEAARTELKPFGIQVLTVKPGFVQTDMTAKNRFPMPFLMDVNKASKIIWDGIQKNKKVISFPLPMFLITKLISFIPNSIFDFLTGFYRKNQM